MSISRETLENVLGKEYKVARELEDEYRVKAEEEAKKIIPTEVDSMVRFMLKEASDRFVVERIAGAIEELTGLELRIGRPGESRSPVPPETTSQEPK